MTTPFVPVKAAEVLEFITRTFVGVDKLVPLVVTENKHVPDGPDVQIGIGNGGATFTKLVIAGAVVGDGKGVGLFEIPGIGVLLGAGVFVAVGVGEGAGLT